MLNFPALTVLFFLPLTLFFFLVFYTYFLLNSSAAAKLVLKRDSNQLRSTSLNNNMNNLAGTYCFYPYYLMSLVYFFIFRGYEEFVYYAHFCFSNFVFSLFFYILCFNFILYSFFLFFIKNSGRTAGLDFLISVILIFFCLPYAVFSNTLLALFFVLEVSSNLVLYSIISGSTLFKANNKLIGVNTSFCIRRFFNLLFVHFWVSFFSSMIIVNCIVNLYITFGTTEWAYLEFLGKLALRGIYRVNLNFAIVALATFFIAFLIKLGVSPFFLFKIEVYKGLALYNIFIYSTVFFINFFILFFLVAYYYLPMLIPALLAMVVPVLFMSIIFIVLFLFDATILRNFFALSSLINSTNLLILLI